MSHLKTAKRLGVLLFLSLMLAACDTGDAGGTDQPGDVGLSDIHDDADVDGARLDARSGGDVEDGLSEDSSSNADTPDVDEPVEGSEARGELDISFASGQPTPGLFVGPEDLRADASALMLTSDGGVLTAGRGRLKGELPSMFALHLGAPGALDSSYGNNNGVQTVRLGPEGRDILVLAGTLQEDGKSLICGNVRGSELGRSRLYVARLNRDGSLDDGFGDEAQMLGRAFFDIPEDGPNSLCWTLKVLPDGSILAGGQVAANNTMTPLLMRLHPDGSLDTSFGNTAETPGISLQDMGVDGALVYAKIRELNVLESGKILALIDAIDLQDGQKKGFLLRYHHDGRIDESFGVGPRHAVALQLPDAASHEVFDFTVDPTDGRIFVAGQMYDTGDATQSRFFVHALDATGQTDSGFAGDGTYILSSYNAAARAITLQSNGKIIATGSAMTHPNSAFLSGELLVVRLLGDGELDETFAADGATPGVFVWAHPEHTFYGARAALDDRGRLTVTGSTPDDPNLSPRGHGFVLRVR